jgi:hypothetical protein
MQVGWKLYQLWVYNSAQKLRNFATKSSEMEKASVWWMTPGEKKRMAVVGRGTNLGALTCQDWRKEDAQIP